VIAARNLQKSPEVGRTPPGTLLGAMRRGERGAANRRVFPARIASSRNILTTQRWSVDALQQFQSCARAMSRDHRHKLARNRKQHALQLRFFRFETMMRRAGWVARRRPLAGPLSPCGSQPATKTLPGRFVSPNGPAGLTVGVRELRYKGSALARCASQRRGYHRPLDRLTTVPSISTTG